MKVLDENDKTSNAKGSPNGNPFLVILQYHNENEGKPLDDASNSAFRDMVYVFLPTIEREKIEEDKGQGSHDEKHEQT